MRISSDQGRVRPGQKRYGVKIREKESKRDKDRERLKSTEKDES